ncbi:MAG: 2OG-Fe(II) oxygenase [Elusimicrobiota bacterium]|nr:2OG-Fe(II) oxygenase [Elusimicrobiota bacterium]
MRVPGLAVASPAAAARAFRRARPFRHAAIDGFLTPALARALRRDLAADTREAFLEGRDLAGSFAICRRPEVIGPGFRRLQALLDSPALLRWLEALSGVRGLRRNADETCGGLFRYDHDAEMDVHLDSHDVDAHCAQTGHPRKLNLLLYLSHGWKAEWGGLFEAYRDPSRQPESVIAPLFNRCVVFDNHHHSWHGVTRVDLPVAERARARYAMIANYYSADPAGTRRAPPRHNWWMPRPLPAHLRPGRKVTLADALEYARLDARRDQRLRELRELERCCRELRERPGRAVAAPAPPPAPGRFGVLDAIPPFLRPGRVLSRADAAAARRTFAAKDRELRRLYARQYGFIRALKAAAPHLAPAGY